MNIAEREGAKGRYFTGKPCKYGHVAERYIAGAKCVVCAKSYADKWKADNPEKRAAVGRLWQSNNKEKHNEAARKHYAKNPQHHTAWVNEWNRKNAHIVNERNGRKRANKRRATPAWADRTAIREIYASARAAGVEVDHIVPLCGPMVQGFDMWRPINAREFFGPLMPVVQGLHVEHNLRLFPKAKNIQKSNRTWPDMPATMNN